MKPVVIQAEARLELAIARLQRNPEWCPPHKRTGFRKKIVNRFPYNVFFMELPDCIWGAAIANMNRRPDYWMKRRMTNE